MTETTRFAPFTDDELVALADAVGMAEGEGFASWRDGAHPELREELERRGIVDRVHILCRPT